MKKLNILTHLSWLALSLVLTGCNTKKMTQSSGSMEPTIPSGDTITVDLTSYRSTEPSRWDVVVFESPIDSSTNWCSRIVGLPGEKIQILDGKLVIDGQTVQPPSRLRIAPYKTVDVSKSSAAPRHITLPFEIPNDSYFVLGDNVSNALDSRFWGSLKKSKIAGKVEGK
jgi:signal peptidase I